MVFGAGVAADAHGRFGRGVVEGVGSWAWVGAALGVAVGSAAGVRVGAGLGVGAAVGIAAAFGIEVAEAIGVGGGTGVAVGGFGCSARALSATVAGTSGVGSGVEQPKRKTKKEKDRNRRTKESPLATRLRHLLQILAPTLNWQGGTGDHQHHWFDAQKPK